MPSVYYPEELIVGDIIRLDGDEFHHLIHVARYQLNDSVKLNNGKGSLAEGRIISINKKQAEIEIIKIESKFKSQPEIAVAFALLKNKNDLWIVEKLTELGVSHFYPIETRFSLRKNKDSSQDKMLKTAITAIKQCDNAFLPQVYPVMPLDKAILHFKQKNYQLLVASEIENGKPLLQMMQQETSNPVCFFIGPEGGFHPDEFQMFSQSGVQSFSLGNHILRAETAAIAVAAQLTGFYFKTDLSYY